VTGAPHLYIITDRHACLGRPLPAVIAEALAGAGSAIRAGARVAVQLREKDLDARPLLTLARMLRALTADAGAELFINDRVDVALAVGADGVQLGGRSLTAADVFTVAPTLPVAVSLHRPDEVVAAKRNPNVTFGVFSPVYPTPKKTPAVGLDGPFGLRAACQAAGALPVLALGSIGPEKLPECLAAGAVGVACIRAVLSATNPNNVVSQFMISSGF
jgi:thiamine-phosphate pyrophosphorylase